MTRYVVIDEHGFGGPGTVGRQQIEEVEASSVIEAARERFDNPDIVLDVGQVVGNVTEVVSDPPPNKGGKVRVLVVRQ